VLYVFDPYVLDTQLSSLCCRGRRLSLQPKTLDVLRLLIDRQGEVVSRKELFESIWSDEVVSEGNLTQHIFMLRQAFTDATPEQAIVVTVPGKGYRFARTVARQPAAPVESTASEWRLYLRGRFFADRRNCADLSRAISHFEQSLVIDQKNVAAHEGLAEAHALYAEYLFGAPEIHFAAAREHAERALTLDSASSDACAILGDVAFFHDWDRDRASEYYARAVAIAPDSKRARISHAWFLSATGRHATALAEASVALRSEPYCPKLLTALAALKFYARRPAEAVAHCNDVLAMDPDDELVRFYLALSLMALGEAREALRVSEEVLDKSYPQHFLTTAATAAARYGDSALAKRYRGRLVGVANGGFVSSLNLGLIHVALGEPSQAIAALRQGVTQRDPWLVFLGEHPLFEPLHFRPDFTLVLRRVA